MKLKDSVIFILLSILVIVFSPLFTDNYIYFDLIFIVIGTLLLFVLKFNSNVLPFKALIVIIMVFLICLVFGLFGYRIGAVTSFSMKPNYYRGDAIIIKKLNSSFQIEKGMVIAYKRNNEFIIHRVVDIDIVDNVYLLTTKGDFNDNVDDYKISINNVYGIVVKRIPYIGYPSVWFSELVN